MPPVHVEAMNVFRSFVQGCFGSKMLGEYWTCWCICLTLYLCVSISHLSPRRCLCVQDELLGSLDFPLVGIAAFPTFHGSLLDSS